MKQVIIFTAVFLLIASTAHAVFPRFFPPMLAPDDVFPRILIREYASDPCSDAYWQGYEQRNGEARMLERRQEVGEFVLWYGSVIAERWTRAMGDLLCVK